jgi:hypothetical protein
VKILHVDILPSGVCTLDDLKADLGSSITLNSLDEEDQFDLEKRNLWFNTANSILCPTESSESMSLRVNCKFCIKQNDPEMKYAVVNLLDEAYAPLVENNAEDFAITSNISSKPCWIQPHHYPSST